MRTTQALLRLSPLASSMFAEKNRRSLSSFKSCGERGTDNATNYRQGRLVLFIAVLTHERGGLPYFFVFAAPEERPCTEKGKRGRGKKKSALRLR